MSKKSRRARAKFKTTQQIMGREQVRQSEVSQPVVDAKAVKSVADTSTLTQSSRYQHIVPELIRIAIIGGVLFILTVILSFVM